MNSPFSLLPTLYICPQLSRLYRLSIQLLTLRRSTTHGTTLWCRRKERPVQSVGARRLEFSQPVGPNSGAPLSRNAALATWELSRAGALCRRRESGFFDRRG